MVRTIEKIEMDTIEFNSTDLNLYLELGHTAASAGDEDEARNWYSIGLKIALGNEDSVNEKLFTRFIQTLY